MGNNCRQPEFIGNPDPAFDRFTFKPFGAIAIIMNIVIANLFFDIFNKDTNRTFIGNKEITDRRFVAQHPCKMTDRPGFTTDIFSLGINRNQITIINGISQAKANAVFFMAEGHRGFRRQCIATGLPD